MNKQIVMTWYRRAGYSRQVAEALAKCRGVEDYSITIFVEPGFDEVGQLALTCPLPNKTVVLNDNVLGCTPNIFKALDYGFERSDYVILLEDDVVPAIDCLEYFEWAGQHYKSDPTVLTVGAYERQFDENVAPFEVHKAKWFTPWGWATWQDRWQEMKSQWGFGETESWDCIVNKRIRKGRCEVKPKLARTQNIGAENGTYCPSANWHKTHQFNRVWRGMKPDSLTGQFTGV